jgi:hypothetical protein
LKLGGKMGATSVTGIGTGSAESACKGAQGRQTLGVGHLIGPHVVSAGVVSLNGSGTASLEIPPLSGASTDYVTIATQQDASSPSACGATIAESNGIWTISFKGENNGTLSYAVISVGN